MCDWILKADGMHAGLLNRDSQSKTFIRSSNELTSIADFCASDVGAS